MLGAVFGYVFYDEGRGKTAAELAGFVVGISILLAGFTLLLLQKGDGDRPPQLADAAAALIVPLHSLAS